MTDINKLAETKYEAGCKEEKERCIQMYIRGRKDFHLDWYPEKHAKETYDELFITSTK